MTLRQESIQKWIINDNYAKPYFFLDWIPSHSFPISEAKWYKKIPSDMKVAWRKTIKIGYREVSLCSSYIPDKFTGNIILNYTSFLISHLQKAVRRKNYKNAVCTGNILLHLDLVKLMRRLPIIMIEDSFMNKSFTTLIWLMCLVSSGYDLNENQKKWVLGLIFLITKFEFKEYISPIKNEWVFNKNIKQIHNLNNNTIQDIIYCLETRKCYGGLEGDKYMIMNRCIEYINIFKNTDDILFNMMLKREIIPIYLDILYINKNEWLLEAYDFHCFSSILNSLVNEYDDYSEDEFKEAIWFMSSSLNFRSTLKYNKQQNKYLHIKDRIISEDIYCLWNKIKYYVRRRAKYYIYFLHKELNDILPKNVKVE